MRAFLLVLLAGSACAWTPLKDERGQVLAWPEEAWPLPLADGPLAWRRAAADWTQAADLGFAPLTETKAPAPDGVVALAEVHDPAEWAELATPGAVAFTLITAEETRLVDADVLLNTAGFRFSEVAQPRSWHLGTVISHELGHVLGLGHACEDCSALSPDDPRTSALMVARLEPGAERLIAADDRAGAAAVLSSQAVDRPQPAEAMPTELGWSVAPGWVQPGLARVWSAAEAGPPLPLSDPLALPRSGDGPWHLELWSASGQGEVLGPLPVFGPKAPPSRTDGDGCHQIPGLSLALLPLLSLLPLWRKR